MPVGEDADPPRYVRILEPLFSPLFGPIFESGNVFDTMCVLENRSISKKERI